MTLSKVAAALALSFPFASAEGDDAPAWEWAGTFKSEHLTHTWYADKVGSPLEYADPSMRIVFYSVTNASDIDASIHKFEDAASTLIESTDGSCTDVTSGGTIDMQTQPCYNLVFDKEKATTMFTVNTPVEITAFVVFAQHVPTEFEKDNHYLKDPKGEIDVEPILQEGGDHHHHHGHGDGKKSLGISCACAQDEYSFPIDCSATVAMKDALKFLQDNGCAQKCDSDECTKQYLIIQSHHDYCPEAGIPEEIEDGFHDYDEQCRGCDIVRKAVDGAPNCPTPNCEDGSGDAAYQKLISLGCTTDCSGRQECKDNFFTLRTVHDLCDHDAITQESEEGLHDFEGPCEDVVCNFPGSEVDQLACQLVDGGSGTGDASLMMSVSSLSLGAAMFLQYMA